MLTGCKTGKSVSNLKEIKKSINTIEVLPVGVDISTLDFFKKQTSAPDLAKQVSVDIHTHIKEVLDKKYGLIKSDSLLQLSDKDYHELIILGEKIVDEKMPLEKFKLPQFYDEIKSNLNNRFSLLLLVDAQYCINFPSQHNTLWIDPMVSTYIIQYLYLIDNSNASILHFNKTKSNGNVSIKSSVEQITLSSLKKLYYL